MSNIIIFVKSNADNVAVKKDSIIGFDKIGNEYRIFLNGGGYIDIRAGEYEYDQLIKAMERDDNFKKYLDSWVEAAYMDYELKNTDYDKGWKDALIAIREQYESAVLLLSKTFKEDKK